jgi:hypothetical protein
MTIELETDYKLIHNLLSEKLMKWTKATIQNNDRGLPYFAEYWLDEQGIAIEPVNFWNPATDIKDCYKMINIIKEINPELIDKLDKLYDGKHYISEATSQNICELLLKAEGIEVS